VSSDPGQIEVLDNPDASRFELRLDGELVGSAFYRPEPGRIVFTHTEIGPSHKGEGLGGRLARGALEDVRRRGLAVVPVCPFIAGYIRSHSEYRDLVVPEVLGRIAGG
jgi:uncharacterized protein